MAINFPNSPTNGQQITEGNIKYVYNSAKGYWESSDASVTTGFATESFVNNAISNSSSTTIVADMAGLIALTGMSAGDQAYITANNKLYFYNGSGWYLIATVSNDSPSAITGVDGAYSLAIDGSPTTITAVSTDPEGFPLTWSYTTSGLGSIATITNTDGVFTITPSTVEANAGTFTLTISATDGVNGAVSAAASITLDFIVIVTNSRYTTLLKTVTAASDNNNITDSSSSNHTITANGDVHAGTFSPYRHGGYSTFFDGTGDYLTFPYSTSNTVWYDDDFTIEAWVYYWDFTDGQGQPIVIKHGDATSTNNYWSFGAISNGTLMFYYYNGSSVTSCVSTTTLTLNTWHHIAMCHNDYNNEINLYLDGTNVKTHTVLGTPQVNSSKPMVIGNNYNGYFNGYIRDLRVVKGTEVYISTFTVPDTPLTAITNTKFLLGSIPYFKDQSTLNNAITVYGDASLKPKSPFDNIQYDTIYGGSVYFDGAGDYLEVSQNTDFQLGTTGTINFWMYVETLPSSMGVLLNGYNDANSISMYIHSQGDNFNIEWRDNFNDYYILSGIPNTKNVWTYVSVVRTGTTLKTYFNGVENGSVTVPSNSEFGTDMTFKIGSGGTVNHYKGYLSDYQIIKGTAVVPTPSTIPTGPSSTHQNSKLHIKGTDASIIDKSQSDNLKILGNVVGASVAKFSNSFSTYFDASGGATGSSSIRCEIEPIRTRDYTIEGWWKPNMNGLNSGGVFQLTTSYLPSNHSGIAFGYAHPGSTPTIYTNNTYNYMGSTPLSNDGSTWYYFAIARSSNSTRCYIDGSQVGNAISGSYDYTGTFLHIGGWYSSNYMYRGHLQDFRITNGLARYTGSSHTVPTEPLKG